MSLVSRVDQARLYVVVRRLAQLGDRIEELQAQPLPEDIPMQVCGNGRKQ